ncbi:MAG: hypothetical protein WCI55_06155 [Armatimonadota bacterium]
MNKESIGSDDSNSQDLRIAEISKLDEASYERSLNKSELSKVWEFAKSNDAHERFRAYRILEDYIDPKNLGVFIDLARRELHWLPRTALYATILEVELPASMAFLEEQFEAERNPDGKYILASMMRDEGNQKVLEYCANNKSRRARWIFSRLEAQYMLGQITLESYQKALKRMLRNRQNWRFIEPYLESAGLPKPSKWY